VSTCILCGCEYEKDFGEEQGYCLLCDPRDDEEGVVLLAHAARHRDPHLTTQPPLRGVFGPSLRLACV
jgi:hypothetical protein